jgi:hypothetical protein
MREKRQLGLEMLESRYALNAAPVLDASPDLRISQSITSFAPPIGSVGTLVSSFIDAGGSLGNYSDTDGDLPGVAITHTSLGGGRLWYSTDGGNQWKDVGSVSEKSARVLYADQNTRLFFQSPRVPEESELVSLRFRAWDRTSFVNGQGKVDTTPASSPSAVAVVETLPAQWPELGGSPRSLALSPDGNLLAVADRKAGIVLIDVSSPAEPVVASRYQMPFSDMMPSGGREFQFADNDTLVFNLLPEAGWATPPSHMGPYTLDVSNPSAPFLADYGERQAWGYTANGERFIHLEIDLFSAAGVVMRGNQVVRNFAYSRGNNEVRLGNIIGMSDDVILQAFRGDYQRQFELSIGVRNTTDTSMQMVSWQTFGVPTSAYPGQSGEWYVTLGSSIAANEEYWKGVLVAEGLGSGMPVIQTSYATEGSAEHVVTDLTGRYMFVADRAGKIHVVDLQSTQRFSSRSDTVVIEGVSPPTQGSYYPGILPDVVLAASITGAAASSAVSLAEVLRSVPATMPVMATAASLNQSVITNPVVLVGSDGRPQTLVIAGRNDLVGNAIVVVSVEIGGPDFNLTTRDDNQSAHYPFTVTQLQPIQGAASRLATDSSSMLYVDATPVAIYGKHVDLSTWDFAPQEAVSSDMQNELIVVRGSTAYRLLADGSWQVASLFTALRNMSTRVLDVEARGLTRVATVRVAPNAYEIEALLNPLITVVRGQTYTFDLDVPDQPFYLQTAPDGYDPAKVLTAGFSGNGRTFGRFEWAVPEDAPDELFYQSGNGTALSGRIVVIDL